MPQQQLRFDDLQWIMFPHVPLTICEVPREGDGSFAAEHPPDLTERKKQIQNQAQTIIEQQL